MIENIILGIIQGIAEWLPISSEGILVLVQSNFFQTVPSPEEAVRTALWLHLGTFVAALVYFWNDVIRLLTGLVYFKKQDVETKNTLVFLIVSTLISGVLGIGLLKIFLTAVAQAEQTGRIVTAVIGVLLIGTALLDFFSSSGGYKSPRHLKFRDGILLGIAQGFAALPGFSRSGLTVSALLLRKFDKAHALKLSFLMSLPIVLAGNIILNFSVGKIALSDLAGVAASFIFGLATIHALLKFAQKIQFGYFLLFFGVLTILASLI